MRNIVAIGLLAGALAIYSAPSMAAGKDCATEMKRVDALVPPNASAGKGAMARAELKIASEKASMKDEQGCLAHVDKAEKAMQ